MMEHSIEDFFERNADMRLLELRHSGTPSAARPVLRPTSFGAESIVPPDPAMIDPMLQPGPLLRLHITALPKSGLIAGTIVGVAIDVFNDGDEAAPEMLLQLSLPVEMEFRRDSLTVDGRAPTSPDRLFGDGLWLPRLVGLAATKVTFQVVVLAGLSPLFLQPHLHASGVPIVGTVGTVLKRGNTSTLPPDRSPRPFYEYEDDESDDGAEPETEATTAIFPPVLAPVDEPQNDAPSARAPEPALEASGAQSSPVSYGAGRTVNGPGPALAEPPPPIPEGIRLPTALPQRYRTFDAPGLAFVERLFTGDTVSANAHFALIATIACTMTPAGADCGGLDASARRELSNLARSVVLERLGKGAPTQYDNTDLQGLSLEPPLPTLPKTHLRLSASLRQNEANALAGLLAPSARDASLRLRVVLAGLSATAIDGKSYEELSDYRSAMLSWLVPLCVASSAQHGTRPITPNPTVNQAAREALRVLRRALDS